MTIAVDKLITELKRKRDLANEIAFKAIELRNVELGLLSLGDKKDEHSNVKRMCLELKERNIRNYLERVKTVI